MRTLALTLIIFLCFSSDILSQNFKGTVIDAESKAPLSYVNIGVLNKNMGVISRDDGSFEIDLSKAASDDTLVFSMIGFESMMFKTFIICLLMFTSTVHQPGDRAWCINFVTCWRESIDKV